MTNMRPFDINLLCLFLVVLVVLMLCDLLTVYLSRFCGIFRRLLRIMKGGGDHYEKIVYIIPDDQCAYVRNRLNKCTYTY